MQKRSVLDVWVLAFKAISEQRYKHLTKQKKNKKYSISMRDQIFHARPSNARQKLELIIHYTAVIFVKKRKRIIKHFRMYFRVRHIKMHIN